MTTPSRSLSRDVRSAYASFNAADYTDPSFDFDAVPRKAQAALERFANPNLDVAEFTTKKVDGKKTFAVYVPNGAATGDVKVVDSSGKALATGSLADGKSSFDWNRL